MQYTGVILGLRQVKIRVLEIVFLLVKKLFFVNKCDKFQFKYMNGLTG